MNPPLPLRDVHPGLAPSWWPPAPGWWLVAAGVLLLVVALAVWRTRRRRRRAAFARIFDNALAQATGPAEKLALASELLRRTARRIDRQADRLQGEAWLQFLDAGLPSPVFQTGAGALLLDGAFRPDVDPQAAQAACAAARMRYLDWVRRR